MKGALPQVTAILVNWNGARDTIECVRSLKSQRDVQLDIIVVDNNSSALSEVALLQETLPSDVHLILNTYNYGFSGANNIGMRHAIDNGAEYVLIINNDTIVVDQHLVAKLIDAVETDRKIGLASPTIFYYPATKHVWYAGAKLSLWSGWKHLYRVPTSKLPLDTGYACGCCILAPVRYIRQVGNLPEPYFLGVEDIEWSLRAKNSGWRVVYVADATLMHKDSSSSRDQTGVGVYSPARIYYEHRNTIWLIRQYGNWPQRWIVWPVLLSVRWGYKLTAYLVLRRWAKLQALLRAIRDGVLTKPATAEPS